MAHESPKSLLNSFLGHLPPWPRTVLNDSIIAMEQAYRQRKGLPLLTEEDIAALKAGEPMPWESDSTLPVSPSSLPSTPTTSGVPAPLATVASPILPSAAAATVTPSAGIREEVAKLVVEGKKWSKSAVAAEQARRGRKGLPPLTDAEITALLGEPATPEATVPPVPTPATSASVPRPTAAAASVTAPVAREGESTRYVGRPAVGTSKAVASAGVRSVGPKDNEINRQRRRLVWASVAAFLTAWLLAFFRFFLPRALLNLRALSRLVIRRSTVSESIPSGSRNTESGWIGRPIACL